MSVYVGSGIMASGDVGNSQSRGDRSGVRFRCEPETAWNVPESYVTLDSPGVMMLDTAVVPDVLGFWVRYEDAAAVGVLPGRVQNSVQLLIPDAIAEPRGLHYVTLVNFTNQTGSSIPMSEMANLRRQWPTSLLAGMKSRQTDL